METDRSDVEEGLVLRAPIQSLNVGERVREAIAGNANLVCREAVKHKGVVGIGTVRDGNIGHGLRADYC